MSTHTPCFEGPIEGWFVNYSRAHYWRVQRTMPWDDLAQEAYICFLRVAKRYPDIETPQHFMALFKTAWIRKFTDFANADTHDRCVISINQSSKSQDGSDDYESQIDPVGEVDGDGDLAIMLRQAPREVIMVMNLFLNAPTEIAEVALSGWRGKDKRCRAGGSKQICKLLGLPLDLDVMQMVDDYFKPSI